MQYVILILVFWSSKINVVYNNSMICSKIFYWSARSKNKNILFSLFFIIFDNNELDWVIAYSKMNQTHMRRIYETMTLDFLEERMGKSQKGKRTVAWYFGYNSLFHKRKKEIMWTEFGHSLKFSTYLFNNRCYRPSGN